MSVTLCCYRRTRFQGIRMSNRIRVACAKLVLGFAVAFPSVRVEAQVPGAVYTVVVPAGQFGSPAFLSAVAGGIAAARKFCSDLGDSAYRVDCLAERLGVVADSIPEDSDYGEVSQVLRQTSADLERLARSNRDTGRGRSHATRSGTDERTTRPLTPVAPAAAASVNQRAIEILENTETVLLRSAESSAEKRNQYAQIAQAVGSNKVLLRA